MRSVNRSLRPRDPSIPNIRGIECCSRAVPEISRYKVDGSNIVYPGSSVGNAFAWRLGRRHLYQLPGAWFYFVSLEQVHVEKKLNSNNNNNNDNNRVGILAPHKKARDLGCKINGFEVFFYLKCTCYKDYLGLGN